MSRSAPCVECGQWFPVASNNGPLPARCPKCKRAHEKALAARRQHHMLDPREIRCVDCQVNLPWSGKNRPKLRCDECRKVHNLAMSRVRYASDRESDPELARERWRQGYRRHAERIRQQKLDAHYRKRYGLSLAEVRQMREERGNRCDICREPPTGGKGARLHVDHCHTEGHVRGLLCGNCNTMIGLAREDPAILLAAIEYLKKE